MSHETPPDPADLRDIGLGMISQADMGKANKLIEEWSASLRDNEATIADAMAVLAAMVASFLSLQECPGCRCDLAMAIAMLAQDGANRARELVGEQINAAMAASGKASLH